MEHFKWLPIVYEKMGPAQISVLKPEAKDLIEQFGTIGVIVKGGHRGYGHGTKAMVRAIMIAVELGHTEVRFVVARSNLPSRRMIERTGAKLVSDGPERRYVLTLGLEQSVN